MIPHTVRICYMMWHGLTYCVGMSIEAHVGYDTWSMFDGNMSCPEGFNSF